MLSNPNSPDSRLKDFVWQISEDGENWEEVKASQVRDNDTFWNILNFPQVKARYLRLLITDWHGYAPR
jgi:hypothetical protein